MGLEGSYQGFSYMIVVGLSWVDIGFSNRELKFQGYFRFFFINGYFRVGIKVDCFFFKFEGFCIYFLVFQVFQIYWL